MKSGKVHEYAYYRCGNLEPGPDQPGVRWREGRLEEAIANDLSVLRIPNDERRDWFRRHLAAACDDQIRVREEQNRQARKRLAELERIQQRLLDGYLAGAIEKEAFTAKTAEIKVETERLQERLADAKAPGGGRGRARPGALRFRPECGP